MPEELGAGTRIGDFEILEVAGAGGMGVVYRATQLSLGRTVALKVISDQVASQSDFQARFKQESRLAARVEHPSVVATYGAGEHDGRLWIAMQWIDGQDLRQLLAREDGPLAPADAISIIGQVGGALDAVHEIGLVHRDVKPGNIMVRRRRDRWQAWLTDFGLAKNTAETGGDGRLTRTGFFVGTARYASPEQVRGLEGDGRSDLYALGCVAFEALTGRAPFGGLNEMAMWWAHVNEPRPVASEVNPGLGTAYDDALQQAMAIDADARLQTGADLSDALGAAMRARGGSDSATRLRPAAPPDSGATRLTAPDSEVTAPRRAAEPPAFAKDPAPTAHRAEPPAPAPTPAAAEPTPPTRQVPAAREPDPPPPLPPPGRAPDPTPPYQQPTPGREATHVGAYGAGAGTAPRYAGGGAAPPYAGDHGAPQPPPPPPRGSQGAGGPPQRRRTGTVVGLGLLALVAAGGIAVGTVAATGGFSSDDPTTTQAVDPPVTDPPGTGGTTGATDATTSKDKPQTKTPSVDDQRADQKVVVEVLRSYQAAYSARDADSISSLLTPGVTRHGLRAGGCSETSGRPNVVQTYREQFSGGTGTYTLSGLNADSVLLKGSDRAEWVGNYVISPGGAGQIDFTFAKLGGDAGWRIQRVDANC